MTAEPIARVVADLRRDRIRWTRDDPDLAHLARVVFGTEKPHQINTDWGARIILRPEGPGALSTIVDSTAIYDDLAGRARNINLYDDHVIAPAWMEASVCFVNQHGNVIVMASYATERDRVAGRWDPEPHWATDLEFDWRDARWAMTTLYFIGGRGGLGPMPTTGPVLVTNYAISGDGQPLDLHWVDVTRLSSEGDMRRSSSGAPPEWDMAMCVHLGTLNLMGCRNVELVDHIPQNRQRRRALERTGVVVGELRVRPTGRRAGDRSPGGGEGAGVPLTTVVGHFSHYGDCCPKTATGGHPPRGLLFGKYEGRYFVPQHARGTRDHGEHRNDYTIETAEQPVP